MFNDHEKTLAVSIITLGLTANLTFVSPLDRPVTAENLNPERVYSPYSGRNYPDEVLFGEKTFSGEKITLRVEEEVTTSN